MEFQPDKEALIKLLNGTIDGHTRSGQKSVHFLDGIKHVRDLFEQTFEQSVQQEELLEFCVSLICSVQPEEPRLNRFLSELEKGILAAAYFLYTAMHPLEYHPAKRYG
ncbi:MAG: hypothetical protein M3N59_03600 [bacterium]|nr:hypothetical protein [bacterium]